MGLSSASALAESQLRSFSHGPNMASRLGRGKFDTTQQKHSRGQFVNYLYTYPERVLKRTPDMTLVLDWSKNVLTINSEQ